MRLLHLFIVSATATSCTGSADSIARQPASLGGYAYDAPASWQHVESRASRSISSTWTPEADNDRRESLVVMRTELPPALVKAGMPTVEKYLTDAQHELPQLQSPSATTSFRTQLGLQAAKVESDFVPPNQRPGKHARYHRVHVIILDGSVLIHVLYTAEQPDYGEQAISLVLNSVHRQEG